MKIDRSSLLGFWLVCLLLLLLAVNAFPEDSRVLENTVRSKLQTPLINLLIAYESNSALSKLPGTSFKELEMDKVRVVIHARELRGVNLIKYIIEELEGKVEIAYHKLIQALIPIAILEQLASLSEVSLIRVPFMILSNEGETISEGVAQIGADTWHRSGWTGQGVKVAINDGGFKGYKRLLGTELPNSVIVRSFAVEEPEEETVHGTAVAEIIHDIAPDATLYLITARTDVEDLAATEWLIEQEVDIINTSWTSILGCYEPDKDELFEPLIAEARRKGILWVTAAGNEGESHWEGDWEDNDGDDWLNFTSSDETQDVKFVEGDEPAIVLTWEGAWCGSTSNDYDLYLYDENGNQVAASGELQSPDQWPPVEVISGDIIPHSGIYHIKMKKRRGSAPVHLDLLIASSQELEYKVSSGSVSIQQPAISPNALTVGAVHWKDMSLEPFSSQGPTKDGRIKPDLVAPDRVSTYIYEYMQLRGTFPGTSASTPHVAGAAALVKQAYPSYTPKQIQEFLESRAEDLGPPGKDNQYGWGLLILGSPPEQPKPLAAPSDLMAVAKSPTSIDLSWQDNSDNEVGFKVEQKEIGENWNQIAIVGKDVESYSDIGLTPNTTYCYRVRAYNETGNSAYSNESCAKTPSGPEYKIEPLLPGEPRAGTARAGPALHLTQYTIEVLEGTKALLVKLRSAGNLNLHMRLRCGGPVEMSDDEIIADFSSISPWGMESISISGIQLKSGIYYIAIENRENSPQEFRVLAATVPVLVPITSDIPISGRVAAAQPGDRFLSITQYVLEIPKDTKGVMIALRTDGVGDLNLHVRLGEPVEIMDNRVVADFSSTSARGIESIVLLGLRLKPGRYYIAVENLEPYPQTFTLITSLGKGRALQE